MQLISGTALAAQLRQDLYQQNQARGVNPTLAIILVGRQEDSQTYVNLKQKAATDIGGICRIVHLAEDVTGHQLLLEIEGLNRTKMCRELFCNCPCPNI